MIAVIDYGVGNIGSVMNMFRKIGTTDVIFTSDEKIIRKADKLLLPGVGAFDRGMQSLKDSGLVPLLKESVLEEKKPLLGICLGMQLLTKGSEEGQLEGLGLIDADTVAFSFPQGSPYKVPHMGWNQVKVEKENPLLAEEDVARFYFVHSYYVKCHNPSDILGTTTYGIPFTCAVQHGNIMGTQFHPEKSHRYGMQLLKKFALL